MIFPPYIAQPCNLPCCRATSNSVPRCSTSASVEPNLNIVRSAVQCSPPPPPRPRPPQPISLEHNFNNKISTSNDIPRYQQRLPSYKMIPIIKSATSMPGGLASSSTSQLQQQHQQQQQSLQSKFIRNNDTNNIINFNSNKQNGYNNPTVAITTTKTQYRGSQPNLCTNNNNNDDGTLSRNYLIPNMDSRNLQNNSNNDNNNNNNNSTNLRCSQYFKNFIPTPLIEQRTMPYYYHELRQRSNNSIFDSNLNILPDMKHIDDDDDDHVVADAAAAAIADRNDGPQSLGAISIRSEPIAQNINNSKSTSILNATPHHMTRQQQRQQPQQQRLFNNSSGGLTNEHHHSLSKMPCASVFDNDNAFGYSTSELNNHKNNNSNNNNNDKNIIENSVPDKTYNDFYANSNASNSFYATVALSTTKPNHQHAINNSTATLSNHIIYTNNNTDYTKNNIALNNEPIA